MSSWLRKKEVNTPWVKSFGMLLVELEKQLKTMEACNIWFGSFKQCFVIIMQKFGWLVYGV